MHRVTCHPAHPQVNKQYKFKGSKPTLFTNGKSTLLGQMLTDYFLTVNSRNLNFTKRIKTECYKKEVEPYSGQF